MSNESIEDAMEWAKGGQFKDVLRREIIRLRHDKESLLNERNWTRTKVREIYESMTATNYALDTVRPAMEKIEGPDWAVVFEALELDRENLNGIMTVSTAQFDARGIS